MENQGWIKLYRKIADHEVFRDEAAFRVFMWILCNCDYKDGSMVSGRFWAGDRLGIKPITYYKILKRLEKKYDLVTLSSNNKNTTILVKKWRLYQQDGNTSDNNKVTTKEQQSNTNQELRIKNKEKNTYSSLSSLDEETIGEVATQYSVSPLKVKDLSEDLALYCQSNGKRYANYKAALQNWVRRAIKEEKIKVIHKEVYDQTIPAP